MTNLTHDQEMKLSELLFKALWPDKCWHRGGRPNRYNCCKCSMLYPKHGGVDSLNPNLLSRSAFLDVFDAVKGREDFQENFCDYYFESGMVQSVYFIPIKHIASPHFQLEILKWLLKKDGRLGELEKIMKGVGDV